MSYFLFTIGNEISSPVSLLSPCFQLECRNKLDIWMCLHLIRLHSQQQISRKNSVGVHGLKLFEQKAGKNEYTNLKVKLLENNIKTGEVLESGAKLLKYYIELNELVELAAKLFEWNIIINEFVEFRFKLLEYYVKRNESIKFREKLNEYNTKINEFVELRFKLLEYYVKRNESIEFREKILKNNIKIDEFVDFRFRIFEYNVKMNELSGNNIKIDELLKCRLRVIEIKEMVKSGVKLPDYYIEINELVEYYIKINEFAEYALKILEHYAEINKYVECRLNLLDCNTELKEFAKQERKLVDYTNKISKYIKYKLNLLEHNIQFETNKSTNNCTKCLSKILKMIRESKYHKQKKVLNGVPKEITFMKQSNLTTNVKWASSKSINYERKFKFHIFVDLLRTTIRSKQILKKFHVRSVIDINEAHINKYTSTKVNLWKISSPKNELLKLLI